MTRKSQISIIVIVALMSATGCKKKAAKKQRPAARRASSFRPVTRPTGPATPPATVAKALGQAPGMMMRANLAAWWTSPLTAPLLASSQDVMKKAFGACAAKFPVAKLTKAFFVQSSGQVIQRARDMARNSHYIVFATDFDVPALFACLIKAGTYKAVKLGGATAYQATKTPDKRKHPGTKTSWWFAPTPRSMVIVDGPWAKKVTPGKGPLGTGAWLKHVGPEALRAWATRISPDLRAAQGFVNLVPDVHGRVQLTWRDDKDARGVAKTLRSPKKLPAFLAPLVSALHVSVQGKNLTASIRLPIARAKVLFALLQQMLTASSSSSAGSRTTDKDAKPPRPPIAVRDPKGPIAPKRPRAAAARPRP